MANQEDQNDAHENCGQVVLLLAPGLVRGRGRVSGHGHLAAVAVFHILVNLYLKKTTLKFSLKNI